MKAVTATLRTLGSMTEDEIKDFVAWVTGIENNFDPGVMSYPRTVMAEASADGEPIAYVPLHPVLVFESLAPKPGTSTRQIARALQEISRVTDQVGQACGFGEAYVVTSSAPEMELATKRGWSCIMHDPSRGTWLLRRKLPLPVLPVKP